MRFSCIAVLALALDLSACGAGSFGEPAAGFDFPQVAQAYIPLHTRDWILATHDGASVVIAPGVAVTNAHNANLIDPRSVIGRVAGYDLMYFRTDKRAALSAAAPAIGEEIIAYGQDRDGKLRVSRGTVSRMWPAAFGFISDAGPGFSGGPVLDAKTGALVGITYGYEGHESAQTRLMVAYTAGFVMDRLAAVERRADAE